MASVDSAKVDRQQKSSPNTGTDQTSGTSSSAKQEMARPKPCPSPANPPEKLLPEVAKWLYDEPPAGSAWLWEDVSKRWCLHLTYCAKHGEDNCELWAFQKPDGSQSYMHVPTPNSQVARDVAFYTQAELTVQSAENETAVQDTPVPDPPIMKPLTKSELKKLRIEAARSSTSGISSSSGSPSNAAQTTQKEPPPAKNTSTTAPEVTQGQSATASSGQPPVSAKKQSKMPEGPAAQIPGAPGARSISQGQSAQTGRPEVQSSPSVPPLAPTSADQKSQAAGPPPPSNLTPQPTQQASASPSSGAAPSNPSVQQPSGGPKPSYAGVALTSKDLPQTESARSSNQNTGKPRKPAKPGHKKDGGDEKHFERLPFPEAWTDVVETDEHRKFEEGELGQFDTSALDIAGHISGTRMLSALQKKSEAEYEDAQKQWMRQNQHTQACACCVALDRKDCNGQIPCNNCKKDAEINPVACRYAVCHLGDKCPRKDCRNVHDAFQQALVEALINVSKIKINAAMTFVDKFFQSRTWRLDREYYEFNVKELPRGFNYEKFRSTHLPPPGSALKAYSRNTMQAFRQRNGFGWVGAQPPDWLVYLKRGYDAWQQQIARRREAAAQAALLAPDTHMADLVAKSNKIIEERKPKQTSDEAQRQKQEAYQNQPSHQGMSIAAGDDDTNEPSSEEESGDESESGSDASK